MTRPAGRGPRASLALTLLIGLLAVPHAQLQRPWRVQTGLEREWPPSWADKRLGWYAAADFQLFEERSWRVDYALEGGVQAYSGGRRYRLGARWVDGRPPISEFFQDTERWLTLGFWVDF